jgi:hypothetical protein
MSEEQQTDVVLTYPADPQPLGAKLPVLIEVGPSRKPISRTADILIGDVEVQTGVAIDQRRGASVHSAELLVPLPAEPGSYRMRVVIRAESAAGSPALERTVELSVRKHRVYLAATGVAPTYTVGDSANLTVTVKCLDGCSMAQREIEIRSPLTSEPARVRLGEAPLPKSESLFAAPVAVTLPAGIPTLELTALIASDAVHQGAEQTVILRITEVAANAWVTVVATDSATAAPLANVTVAMHPFRTLTDETGSARLAVPKGSYRLQVAGPAHHVVIEEIDVQGDVDLAYQLVAEEDENPDERFW